MDKKKLPTGDRAMLPNGPKVKEEKTIAFTSLPEGQPLDPHTEMMKAVGNLSAAAKKYCDAVGVKDLRLVGNVLGDVIVEQRSF